MPTIGRMGRTSVTPGTGDITRRPTPSPRGAIQQSLGDGFISSTGGRQAPISSASVTPPSMLNPKPMPFPQVTPPSMLNPKPMPLPHITLPGQGNVVTPLPAEDITQGPPSISGGPPGFMDILNLIRQNPNFLRMIFGGLERGAYRGLGGGINPGIAGTPRMF